MAAERIASWLRDEALPLWAGAGMDAEQGGFVERLLPDGSPDIDVPKRTMVQARQVYVYSHAALLGLSQGGVATAGRGFDFLMRYAFPDGVAAGAVHSVTRAGVVCDARRDTYDHAFCLLAFSWFYRASGSRTARDAVISIAAAIDDLKDKQGDGYQEDNAGRLPRRQNPHMHLFEAFLAAHEATGDNVFLERAAEIWDLLNRRFLVNDMLLEFFGHDWAIESPPSAGIVEPGHHHEWVWLLARFGAASGRETAGVAHRLYAAARKFGQDLQSGLVFNEIWFDGTGKDVAKRLWPQTEVLKSILVMSSGDGAEANAAADRIFRYFLNPAPHGTWVDRLDACDKPIAGPIPASSFYHVFLAFASFLEGRKFPINF